MVDCKYKEQKEILVRMLQSEGLSSEAVDKITGQAVLCARAAISDGAEKRRKLDEVQKKYL